MLGHDLRQSRRGDDALDLGTQFGPQAAVIGNEAAQFERRQVFAVSAEPIVVTLHRNVQMLIDGRKTCRMQPRACDHCTDFGCIELAEIAEQFFEREFGARRIGEQLFEQHAAVERGLGADDRQRGIAERQVIGVDRFEFAERFVGPVLARELCGTLQAVAQGFVARRRHRRELGHRAERGLGHGQGRVERMRRSRHRRGHARRRAGDIVFAGSGDVSLHRAGPVLGFKPSLRIRGRAAETHATRCPITAARSKARRPVTPSCAAATARLCHQPQCPRA